MPSSNKRCKSAVDLDQDKENTPLSTSRRCNARRKSGGVAVTLEDMPFDIFLEIASHALPLDVFHLTRVSKTLRHTFMSRASIGTWRAARANLEGFPAPFKGMSEPAWVHLAYIKICHFCWTKTVLNPDFYLRCRICPSCSQIHLVGLNPLLEEKPPAQHPIISSIFQVIPTRMCSYQGVKDETLFGRLSDYRDALQHFLSNTVTQDWLNTQAQLKARLHQHTVLCNAWKKTCETERELELKGRKEKRQQAIYDKLVEAGYQVELLWARAEGIEYVFTTHPSVKGPAPLTARAWNKIQDSMITFGENIRRQRLDKFHAVKVNERKFHGRTILRQWKRRNTTPPTNIYPSIADFCQFSEVNAILDQPDDVEVTLESFQPIIAQIPVLCNRWRNGIYKTLDALVNPDEPITGSHAAYNRLNLAKNVLFCQGYHCSTIPEYSEKSRKRNYTVRATPMWFPDYLSHKCCRANYISPYMRGPHAVKAPPDPVMKLEGSQWIAEDDNHGRVPWRGQEFLRKNEVLGRIVRRVIKLAGLDPETATVRDMDEQLGLFECKWCPLDRVDLDGYSMSSDDDDDDEEPRRDRLFVNWRLYVDHVFNNHFFDHEKMKHFVEVIGGRAEDEVPEGYEVGTTEEREVLYECVRCRDMPRELFTGFSKDRIVEHCEEIHDVEDPVQDTHYCEMYGLAGRTTQEKVYLFDEDRVAYNNELSALLAMSLVMMTEATDMLLRMRR